MTNDEREQRYVEALGKAMFCWDGEACDECMAAARAAVTLADAEQSELRAKVARVEALADSHQQPGAWVGVGEDGQGVWVTHLRAALDGYRIEFSTARCAYELAALAGPESEATA